MTLSAYSPADSGTDLSVNTTLSWTDSVSSDYYMVYFSATEADVTNKAAAAYRGIVYTAAYDPRVTLAHNTEYFWRIIAVRSGYADVDSTNLSFTTVAEATLPATSNYKKRHCAAANNKFWYDNDDVPPIKVELSGLTLATNNPISMEEYQQKVYIANGTIKKVVDFVNTKLTVSAMTNYPTRGSTVTQATSNATMIVDFVNSAKTEIYGRTTSGTFVTTGGYTLSGGGMDAGLVPSAVAEASTTPHHYDWTAYAGDSTFYGSIVAQATMLKRYRNRLCLSGNTQDPHQWYQARQDDPYDFLYADEDAQSPVAGQDADAGKIGDIVTAQIPYGDDYFIYGTVGSLWVLRGDAASQGSLDELDNTVGVIDKDAWCKDNQKNLYVLDINGLYRIPYPLGRAEALVDEDVMPTFVEDLGLNPETQRITLGFDPRHKQIYICVTDIQADTNTNYVYDLVTKGFFPETYPDECSPYSLHFYNSDEPEYRKMLVGCSDGYLRYFDDDAKDDDTGIQSSYDEAGCIGHWKLDETSGTDIADASGNGNNGTSERDAGTMGSVAGAIGTALTFDGVNDFITVTDSTYFDFMGLGDFTISAWIKTSDDGNEMAILSTYVSGSDAGFYLRKSASNKLHLHLNDGSNSKDPTTATSINTGAWVHVVATCDRDGNVSLYLDTIAEYADSMTSIGDISNSQDLLIGALLTTPSQLWAGQIDDIKIYNRVLTTTEIGQLYNSGSPVQVLPASSYNLDTKQAIDSYCLLGPVQIGKNVDRNGKTRDFTFLTAGGAAGGSIGDSSDLDYEIFFADNAEEIIEMLEATTRSPLFSGTISAPGRSYREQLKGSGVFMGVRIGNDTLDETWGIERVTADVMDGGRVKKL